MAGVSRSRLTLNQHEIDTVVDTVERLLGCIGEPPSLAPLVTPLLENLKIENNDVTRGMDNQTRITALKRILVGIYKFVVEKISIVFIFDDVQWADPVSMEILYSIAAEAPKLCLLLFTRPIADIQIEELAKIQALPGTLHVQLNGFNLEETEELIRLQYRDALTVNPKLVQAIYKYSSGKPLQIDLLIGALSGTDQHIFINSDQQLTTSKEESLDTLLQNITASGAAMVQFDRLSSAFQDFLKIATILGQYFSLDQLKTIFEFSVQQDTMDDVAGWIKQEDKYQFLLRQESLLVNSDEFYFRHISVLNSIYNAQSFEARAKLHLIAASHYEGILNNDNQDWVLPVATHHFKATRNLVKKVTFMEKLGCFYREAQNTLENLIELVEAHMAGKHYSKAEATIFNDTVRRADWIAHLRKLEPALKYGIKALNIVNCKLPTEPKSIKKEIVKTLFELYLLWQKTKGGKLPYTVNKMKSQYLPMGVIGHNLENGCSKNCVNCPKLRRAQALCYKAMFFSAFLSTEFPIEGTALIVFRALVVDIKTSCSDTGEWIGSLYRAALGAHVKFPFLCNIFTKRAISAEVERPLGNLTHFSYHSASWLFFTVGDFETAYDYLEKSAKYCQSRGDDTTYLASRMHKSSYLFWQGKIKEAAEMNLDFLFNEEIHKTSAVWATLITGLAGRTYVLQGNVDGINKIHARVRYQLDSLPKVSNLTGYGALATYMKSWNAFQNGDVPETISTLRQTGYFYSKIAVLGVVVVDVLFLNSVLLCMFLIDVKLSNMAGNDPARDRRALLEEVMTLKTELDIFMAKANAMCNNKTYVPALWTREIFNVADKMLAALRGSQSGSTGMFTRSIEALAKYAKMPKRQSDLSKFPMISAFVYGIIGRTTTNRAEKASYLSEARKLFTEFGADFMISWCSPAS
ncbi:hypothetical protein HDV05_004024 [Chytridiales sp. JEL 0842]|nr:hypothetical protein HDV05_004024 [Chytridiales sp. JEL 0842]